MYGQIKDEDNRGKVKEVGWERKEEMMSRGENKQEWRVRDEQGDNGQKNKKDEKRRNIS